MLNRSKDAGYDIIFWGHVANGIDRYLPVMAGLKKRGKRPLLFYQNYDWRLGLSRCQKKIISRYGLEVVDFSFFLPNAPILRLINLSAIIFKAMRIEYLYNKSRGLCSRLLKRRINQGTLEKIITRFKPRISFFDNIGLSKYIDYPYGSFFAKKVSDGLGLKTFSICTGSSSYLEETNKAYSDDQKLNYGKIYVPNEIYEAKVYRNRSVDKNTEIFVCGDPAFDTGWKNAIREIYSPEVNAKVKKMRLGSGLRILYLCANTECIGQESEKYKNLKDVAGIIKGLERAVLLIKPHPRYRNERKIRQAMAAIGFKQYRVLDEDPLICYLDLVDCIISFATSAVNDFLPEGSAKIAIYDNFFEKRKVENIYKKDFNYFSSFDQINAFLRNLHCQPGLKEGAGEKERIGRFCRTWISGNRDFDKIAESISEDIVGELSEVEQ